MSLDKQPDVLIILQGNCGQLTFVVWEVGEQCSVGGVLFFSGRGKLAGGGGGSSRAFVPHPPPMYEILVWLVFLTCAAAW